MNNPKQLRPDQSGPHRVVYEKNRRRLLKTTTHCEICGGEISANIKWPDPLSPVADHIIPISKGGHPSDIANMRVVHNRCNRAKSDKLFAETLNDNSRDKVKKGLDLPWSINWLEYRSDE